MAGARLGGRLTPAAAGWGAKGRPDLLGLERSPPTFRAPDAAGYVPRGVMTRNPHEQRHNDHVFVCAAARCAPYFVAVAENYQNCAGSIAKEDMFDAAYPKARLRFVDVAYTVVRDGKEGPQCKRLPCDDKSWSTGCIAPHLVAFYEKCGFKRNCVQMCRDYDVEDLPLPEAQPARAHSLGPSYPQCRPDMQVPKNLPGNV